MTRYFLRRLGQMIMVSIGVTIFAFILQHILPGNLAREIIGNRATNSEVLAFDKAYGLNRPLPVQYFIYLWKLLHGNLGYSYVKTQSVDYIISHNILKDVVLVGPALILSLMIAIPVGIAQARRRNSFVDYLGTGVSFVLYAMPSYFAGLVALGLFAVTWKLFPPEGPQGSTITQVITDPRALALPIITLTLVSYALFTRYMRSSAIDTLAHDYIRTARAKGLSWKQIRGRHLLRNSLLPIATLVGLSLPGIFTAGLATEYVFNYPGIGYQFYQAATSYDYPTELGITVLLSIATVLGNFIADVSYAALDPRVRYD